MCRCWIRSPEIKSEEFNMYARMLSWWRGSGAGEASGSSSNSSPPDGIKKISSGVYRLREPVGAPEVEIVFIHGLQLFDYREAYWKSWMSGKMGEDGEEFCWPMTWLAEDVPGARIWSLSYDSTAWRTNTTGNLDGYVSAETLVQEMVDFAKIGQHRCPVVFVCHSLGGLMAKEIVIPAHDKFGTNEKYKNFLQSIRAYLFYSTPHDGSHLADYFRKMPNMGEMVPLLQVINDGIGRLNSNFERIARQHYPSRWRYSAIGEAHLTRVPFTGMSVKVVEEASARHGYTAFITVPADHFGVCKPDEKTNSSYLTLVKLIEDVVGDNPPPQTADEVQSERRELIYSTVMRRMH